MRVIVNSLGIAILWCRIAQSCLTLHLELLLLLITFEYVLRWIIVCKRAFWCFAIFSIIFVFHSWRTTLIFPFFPTVVAASLVILLLGVTELAECCIWLRLLILMLLPMGIVALERLLQSVGVWLVLKFIDFGGRAQILSVIGWAVVLVNKGSGFASCCCLNTSCTIHSCIWKRVSHIYTASRVQGSHLLLIDDVGLTWLFTRAIDHCICAVYCRWHPTESACIEVFVSFFRLHESRCWTMMVVSRFLNLVSGTDILLIFGVSSKSVLFWVILSIWFKYDNLIVALVVADWILWVISHTTLVVIVDLT